MLDNGISLRCMIALSAWAGAITCIVFAWVYGSSNVGRLALALVGVACTLMVLQDNARTRQVVWRVMRETPSEDARVRRLH